MLIVVSAWVTVIGPHQPSDFRDAALSAAAYFNNWWLIFHHVSYFARFEAPSPLNHLWSLSIEEQFYIFWPFLLLAGTRLVPEVRNTTGVRPRLALCALAMALVSTILMAVLYHPSLDPSRVYYGTDTRAMELLFGAALAMMWPSRRLQRRIRPQARTIIDAAGAVGLLVILLMYWRTGEFSPFLYRGGFVLLSLATVLAVAAMAHPASRLGPLRRQPADALDRRALLRDLPLALPGDRPHLAPRRGQRPEPAQGRAPGRGDPRHRRALLALRRGPDPPRRPGPDLAPVEAGQVAPRAGSADGLGGRSESAPWSSRSRSPGSPASASPTPLTPPARRSRRRSRSKKQARVGDNITRCEGVVHIGDSTSEGLVSTEYLPDPSQLISAQYARVGITEAHLEVSGARSIYEQFEGLPNAQEVAQAWKERRLRRLLGAGDGHQRGRQRRGRLDLRLRRTDRQHDVDDRRRTGDVGERQVAAAPRAPTRSRT